MSVTVLNPGLLTTVQDAGRIGYQQFGVPVSGAVDSRAVAVANILVGNPDDEAVLECTMMGPQLRFDADNCIAITGGDLQPVLDGQPVKNYAAIAVTAGQVLRFKGPKAGCRAYIAFAGGLDIPVVMGSRSTYMKGKIGGVEGRKLQKGDVISFRAPKAQLPNMTRRFITPEFIPRPVYTLRVIMGPQDDAFTPAGMDTFLNETYTVTPEFDRMGCRLEGAEIAHVSGGDIISDGISFGAIQVPSSGKPIIMLADRQTTGGYTKIANVITVDFRLLAQLKAGDKVRFEKISVQQAQTLLNSYRKALLTLRSAMDKI